MTTGPDTTGPDTTEVTGPAPPPPCDPAARRTGIVLAVLVVIVSFTGVLFQSLWNGNDGAWAAWIWARIHDPASMSSDFPPALVRLLEAVCRAAGRMTPWLLRLPSAFAGFGTLLVVHRLVRTRSGPPAAGRGLAPWAAAFVCATAAMFLRHARLVDSQMPLVFLVTLGLFLFWAAWRRDARGRGLVWYLPFLAVVSVAAIDGMLGPVLIGSCVACFAVRERRFGLLALGVAGWGAAVVAGRLVHMELDLGVDGSLPWPLAPSALRVLPAALLPWTLPALVAAVAFVRPGTRFREPLDRFVRSILAGLVLAVLAWSARGGGTPPLVFVPWLAFACGVWIAERSGSAAPGLVARMTVNLTLVVVWLALLALPIGFLYGQMAFPDTVRVAGRLGLAELRAAVALVVTLAFGWTYMRCRRRYRATMWPLAPAGAAALLVAGFGVAGPVLEYHRTLAPVADVVRKAVAAGRSVEFTEARPGDGGLLALALHGAGVRVTLRGGRATIVPDPAPAARKSGGVAIRPAEERARGAPFSGTLTPVEGGRHAREYVVLEFTGPSSLD